MCGSEPCQHQRDGITSLVASANATAQALVERDEALATIERVKALIGDPASPDDAWGTHSEKCYRWHAGCLAVAIRLALEPTQPKGKP